MGGGGGRRGGTRVVCLRCGREERYTVCLVEGGGTRVALWRGMRHKGCLVEVEVEGGGRGTRVACWKEGGGAEVQGLPVGRGGG